MSRHSPESRIDGSFLDLVSYGRGAPGKGRQLLPAQIERIARTVRQTPEVMVKISGGGQTANAVAAHFKYIGRKEFEIETDDGVRLRGKGAEKTLIEDWELEIDRQAESVAAVLRAGNLEAEPGKAKILNTRRIVMGGWFDVRERLRADGRASLANEVERFAGGMPPPQTERESLAQALKEIVTSGVYLKRR